MLEMLAVMAIAGLLGIGSVEGYQAAVRKNQANNILEGAAQRAIAVSQQVALDKDLDNITLGEFPTDAGRGVSFPTSPTKLNEEFFSLPITGLDEATCKQLQMMAGGALRRVDCRDANGAVTAELVYHKDLSEEAETVPDSTGESSNGSGSNDTTSPNCTQYTGTSTSNTGGRAGKASDGDEWCRCPSGKVYTEANGCIVACSGHGTLDANEDCVCLGGYTGEICETQVTCGSAQKWAETGCYCENGMFGGTCIEYCPEGNFLTYTGACRPCPSLNLHASYREGMAYPGSPYSTEECQKCSWKGISYKYDSARKNCVLSECPEGFWAYRRNDNGLIDCYDCEGNWSYHYHSGDPANVVDSCLAACPNRVRGNDGWGEACVLPNYCTGENQFIDGWGDCITCGKFTHYWDPTGKCQRCPGISFSLANHSDDCVIDCPKNNFGDNVGRCCNDDEIYTDIGHFAYGHQYGACCPQNRPKWDGSACVPNDA